MRESASEAEVLAVTPLESRGRPVSARTARSDRHDDAVPFHVLKALLATQRAMYPGDCTVDHDNVVSIRSDYLTSMLLLQGSA